MHRPYAVLVNAEVDLPEHVRRHYVEPYSDIDGGKSVQYLYQKVWDLLHLIIFPI